MTRSATAKDGNTDTESLSFEQALKQLEEIVRRLEGGNTDLEAAIQDYLRGTSLTRHCQKKLEDARLKIESIVKSEDGALGLREFKTQE